MLIDCHTHSYTKEDIGKLIIGMKENGIDKSVIMQWPWPVFDKEVPPFEDVLSNIKPHKNLFLAGSVAVSDEKNFGANLKKMNAALSKKEIVGIKICLGYEHLFANDTHYDKIYEMCVKHNAPVIYHTGDTWSAVKGALVRFANPIYIDDVAVKYPDLKILISHLGNPCWIKETAEVLYKNKNVFADFCGILGSGNKFSKRYNDNLKEQILDLVAYCESPKKLVFGTDYYVHEQKQYVEFLERFTEFSKDDMGYIKHKNAEHLFNI